jgi:hypothetical protein
MSATTTAAARAAVAARVLTLGGSWNQPDVPPDLHDFTGVPDAVPASKAHASFSVRLPSTAAQPGERHRVGVGYRVTHRLVVRFLARVSPREALTSYDAALALETALISVLDRGWSEDLTIYYQGSERATAQTGEWIRIDTIYTLAHLVQLA